MFTTPDDHKDFYLYFSISLYPVDACISFFTATSLVYLFSYQAERARVI
jgi:hypothetical protein